MGVGSGRVLWEGSGKSDQESGTVLTLDRGVFASTAVLAVLASKALNVAIDQIVGDPAFRRAVSGAGARVG